jgi:enoyl reductase-like protein
MMAQSETLQIKLPVNSKHKDLDVAALNFDTLEYVKQLTDAGVERQVAEIHAITVGRAMGMYVNNLVTQEYLDATLDARFAEQDLRIEKRFAEQDAKSEKRFAKQDLRIEKRFAEQDAKFEHRFNKAESDMRVLKWGQALVVATVLLPQLAKLVV